MKDQIKNKSNNKNKYKFFTEWIIPVIAALGIALLINRFLIFNVYIPSTSMVPTINVGDRLMVNRVYTKDNLKRGDILVFYSNELQETLIKRVIGLPGDHIIIKDGIVNVNGEDLQEDYVKNNDFSDDELIYDVPEGKYFFLGDNRPVSKDSRRWINPYVDQADIKGKSILKYYPLKDFGSMD